MPKTNQRLGIILGFIGGLTLSFDVPLIRLAEADPWFIVGLRGGATALIFYALWHLMPRSPNTPKNPLKDRDFLIVSAVYAANYFAFTLAVFNTSTANLVFILAFNPMIAAFFAWAMIGERPHFFTWIAMAATLLGIAIIVSGGTDKAGGENTATSHWFGDLMALACATLLAYAITHIRKTGKDLSLTPGLGGVIALLVSSPIIAMHSDWPGGMGFALANAFILFPVAFFCLSLAPSHIPAPQVGMFYLLETVLAPVWVWMVFGEMITANTALGGAIVLAALFAHSTWQFRRSRSSPTAS